MRPFHTLLLAASITLTGCAMQPTRPATPSAQCSFGDAAWKVAASVDPSALAAARAYGPPPVGARTVWMEDSRGDYRYCVLQAGSNDRCGDGMRVLHLWKQDGRWNTTGWFDASECRRAESGRSH